MPTTTTSLAEGQLKDLIRLVETFGFFLMQLDIRQESTRHTDAVSDICKHLPGPGSITRRSMKPRARPSHAGA